MDWLLHSYKKVNLLTQTKTITKLKETIRILFEIKQNIIWDNVAHCSWTLIFNYTKIAVDISTMNNNYQ